jgi:hypothetical protein
MYHSGIFRTHTTKTEWVRSLSIFPRWQKFKKGFVSYD